MIDIEGSEISFLATTHAPDYNAHIHKHLEGYYTIQFMERGGVSLSYDDESYTLEGAWFWPAYPGPLIDFHAAPGHASWFHRHVGFQGPLVSRWIASGIWLDAPQPAPPGKDYAAFVDEIIAQVRRADHWGRLRATNLMEQLLIELAEARTQPAGAQAWLTDVVEILAREPGFVPDYARVAADLGMGLSTLRRRFKQATGISLHQHVLLSRIAAARTLLGETDMPIKTVAEKLGYDNVYFLSRQFRECAGVSPGVYRKSRQV
jgi:AraC-like DNA-binding protein